MGTLLQIEVASEQQVAAEEAVESAYREVERLDGLLSNYKENSEVNRINREAYPSPLQAGNELISFLSQAQRYSELTGGAFDITIEPLTRLWKVRERKIERMPTRSEIESARSKVNYKNLEISLSDKTVRFLFTGMGIDTGGVGKGYALDRALEKIRDFSVESATLNFGGEILYWTKRFKPKTIGIKNPMNSEEVWKMVSLSSYSLTAAASTSANYERYVIHSFSRKGAEKSFSHILNPKTGRPVNNEIRSITVLSRNAMEADALSTALFAMGFEEGKKFALTLKENGVLILNETKEGNLQDWESAEWKKFVLKEE